MYFRSMRALRRRSSRGLSITVTAVVAAIAAPAGAQTLPDKFQETIIFSGLSGPTAVRFMPDGRVLIAEKRGVVKLFDTLEQTSAPTELLDLRTNVYDLGDRGLLGLAVHPEFNTGKPYIYVLYTHDALIGQTAPRWGQPDTDGDPCPTPPGFNTRPNGGCVVSGRLSRFRLEGDSAGAEEVLVEDWFQQYPSHSIGALAFGPDGYLYASGGDGANYNVPDWGQFGSEGTDPADFPLDPAGEGGALRSQDPFRGAPPADPAGLAGSVIRIDPDTGLAAPDNPRAGDGDANAARIVAYGLRNPYRLTVRPGTNELWIGDVGWSTWEEINVIADPTAGPVNFGWPCFEGAGRQSLYDAEDLSLCEALYGAESSTPGTVTRPYFAYEHRKPIVAGESCQTASSSISGIAFYEAGDYPAGYDGALFFADYRRGCVWVAFPGADGLPNSDTVTPFIEGAAFPVDLQIGPDGDLFYVAIAGSDGLGGTLRRIEYFVDNKPPTARIEAGPTSGVAPLTVNFDASTSSDPDAGDTLTYAWDLDGDGAYDDGTAPQVSYTYSAPGEVTVRLRVADPQHLEAVASQVITAANTPPEPTISAPSSAITWRTGQAVSFAGQATDGQDGALPASALSWSLELRECLVEQECAGMSIGSWNEVQSGSFDAPEAPYPSHLVLRLTAVDSGGLSASRSVALAPETVALRLESDPAGLELALDGAPAITPFSRTVVAGATRSISASSPQSLANRAYVFDSWSDDGAATHEITPTEDTTSSAIFVPSGDVSLNLRGPTGEINPGVRLAVVLTVRNDGGHALDELQLQLQLPEGLQDIDYKTASGSFDATSGRWTGLSLGAQQSAELRIEATVARDASAALELGAVLTVPGVQDPNTSNNDQGLTLQITPKAEPDAGSSGERDAGVPSSADAAPSDTPPSSGGCTIDDRSAALDPAGLLLLLAALLTLRRRAADVPRK
jgi:glucose/arabinose dehydrogenase/PKD repeat protein